MGQIVNNLLALPLKLINPHKPLGTALFDAIAKVSVSVAFEAVAVRKNIKGYWEIYLVQRPENDTAYPGQWHCPGSVLRPAEKDEHVIARLSKREFGTPITKSKFVAIYSHTGEARGHFLSMIYRVWVEGETSKGKWFPIHSLPSNTVTFHKKIIIPLALGKRVNKEVEDARIKTLGI